MEFEEYDEMMEIPKFETFRSSGGSWVECACCRAIMYDTFGNCWSCGSEMTEENKVPVVL